MNLAYDSLDDLVVVAPVLAYDSLDKLVLIALDDGPPNEPRDSCWRIGRRSLDICGSGGRICSG